MHYVLNSDINPVTCLYKIIIYNLIFVKLPRQFFTTLHGLTEKIKIFFQIDQNSVERSGSGKRAMYIFLIFQERQAYWRPIIDALAEKHYFLLRQVQQ